MTRREQRRKETFSAHNILIWAAGILLLLVLVSTSLLSGLFAKYVFSNYMMDSAKVAKLGIGSLELLEHEATLDNGIYTLNQNEVSKNTYNRVIPGVDIAKDPFIRLNIDPEVSLELYIKVAKSAAFPDTVTYALTEDWIEVDAVNGIYKYKNAFDTQFNGTIQVLKNDKLIVSEHYVGNAQDFTLTFNAWLVQVSTDETP